MKNEDIKIIKDCLLKYGDDFWQDEDNEIDESDSEADMDDNLEDDYHEFGN